VEATRRASRCAADVNRFWPGAKRLRGARKASLKYAIISDVHANLDALEVVLEDIDSLGADSIICLGDVVGYNAYPNECIDLIRKRDLPCICGNHDAVACGIEEPWGFNPIALSAAMWTRERLSDENAEWLRNLPDYIETPHFLAVHGAPNDRDCYLFGWEDILPHLPALRRKNLHLCVFGHTHNPGVFSSDGTYSVDVGEPFAYADGKDYFINPGSVGQPRDGDPRAAYGIIDTEAQTYTHRRVAYPVDLAAQEVLDHGLPPFLAERLHLGR
jgi:predicted phosphodiesterase